MKVLLANPPWLRPGWYGVRAGSRWPHMERVESPYTPFPFLLGYAAAVLEADGVDVVAIDACAERIDRGAFVRRFIDAAPDVLVAEISTPSFAEDMETVRALREDAGFDGAILLAGLHKPLYDASFLARHPMVDGALVGEYELTVRAFVRAGGKPVKPIPGLIWRDRHAAAAAERAGIELSASSVLDGGRKHSQTGLDDFPWPARHLFPMERYHDLPGGIPAPSVQMWASRGCSFTCNFCAWPQILYADNAYRTRSADAVADEILALVDQGYRSVYFDDDTFNLGKKRTDDLARAFVERGINVPWGFMGRADTCDPAQYELLAKSGLAAVKYGVESADTARLRQIGKNLDVERVRASVKAVKAHGIKTHLTFMFGLQGETLDTMQRTLDLAYELDPDSAQFTIAVPFPGSRLHDELEESGRLDGIAFEDLDGYRTGVVSTDALEAEQIINFVHGVHRRWETRSRPAGVAPKIPVAEVGASPVSVGLLARAGHEEWLARAIDAVLAQPGPSREIVIVAEQDGGALEAVAAEHCDWATFVDVPAGSSRATLANQVAPACTGQWIALLQAGFVPYDGWLSALVTATKATPEAGALAMQLGAGDGDDRDGDGDGDDGDDRDRRANRDGRDGHPDRDGPPYAALSMSRWGRVLEYKGAAGAGAGARADDGGAGVGSTFSGEAAPTQSSTTPTTPVFAVSSRAGLFNRALLEEAGGFDPLLPDELADADLGLRALLLGYRCGLAEGARVNTGSALRFEDGAEGANALEVRAWARGRVHLALKSLPREVWREAAPRMLVELLGDAWRAGRDGRRPDQLVAGVIDGLRAARESVTERRRVLGRRRVGEGFVRAAFAESEADMAHCRWQRTMQGLG